MRDIEVIDCELRLLAAFRQNFRDGKCRAPSIERIDELLDERWKFHVEHAARTATPTERTPLVCDKPLTNSHPSDGHRVQ